MNDYRLEIAVFEAGREGGQFGPKFHVEGDVPTNYSSCRKTQPFIRYKNVGRTFVHFVTMHAFDGQTDGRTACSWLDHVAFNAAR